jgi:hypothetical protein
MRTRSPSELLGHRAPSLLCARPMADTSKLCDCQVTCSMSAHRLQLRKGWHPGWLWQLRWHLYPR